MLVPFIYELRSRKVPVGTQEALGLAQALHQGLHDSSLDGFYWVARSLLVHSESHLDAFDQAFAKYFKDVELKALEIHQALLDWLKDAQQNKPTLTEAEKQLLAQLDREALEKLFEQRLREQKERHDKGNKWIGTGGKSPFGHSGAPRDGIRVGGEGGNRRAFEVATQRHFKDYRDDLVLDVRQLGLALRKLRAFAREGAPDELDLGGTIEKTAKNLGDLEVVTRPPRKSNTRVILLMDVGGSMDPYAELVSRLFTAAKKATHFRELRTYYFHNCVYGRVYQSARLTQAVPIDQLFAETNRGYKLIMVGDALMAPWELMDRSGWHAAGEEEGVVWLMKLAETYPHAVWLNPEPKHAWFQTTIEVIRRVFNMFPLTLEGLGDAVTHLTRGGRS
ncbi:MAG: VWA domain-containing protein [Archangiaceae bacterium]|nr:VWA domain-containing protein [Archangiaceae bacterium]